MVGVHTVSQGECLSSIAAMYGVVSWQKIYDHPQNSLFKQKRLNPNVACVGDEVYISANEVREESRATDEKHRFNLKRQKTNLRIKLEDNEGKVLSARKYSLSIAGQVYEGKTEQNGLIEHTIQASEQDAILTVWPSDDVPAQACTWELKIGYLDPVQEVTGVQARLNNLGFECGRVDGICGPRTKAAVKEFQRKHGLEVDGIAGPKTQGKLDQVHGC